MKTLHPGVHGGILARRDLPEHLDAVGKHNISLIDVVRSLCRLFASVTRHDSVCVAGMMTTVSVCLLSSTHEQ